MSKTRKLEGLLELIQKLNRQSTKIPILVEGKNDRTALRRLGIQGEIICIKSSRHILYDSLDDISSAEIILLVDFDAYGTKIAKEIIQQLEKKRIKVNAHFWRRLKALVRRDVKDIEGLFSYLEKLKKSSPQ
jgi:5S rRNA maturation endonuclease (ribonuclease M5)